MQRFVGHDRAEIGAADADIDDVADALAGMAFPCAAADPVGKIRHLVQHRMDLGHDILAVDQDGRSARRPQRHVQHRAVLGDVDLVAAEHRLDPFAQARTRAASSSNNCKVSSVMRFLE